MINKNSVKIGEKYGLLTVIDIFSQTKKDGSKYKVAICKCDCGNTKNIAGSLLKSTKRDCGCVPKIKREKNNVKTHGISQTKIYYAWKRMRERCYHKEGKHYKSCGGRGIFICEEWKENPVEFYNWALNNGYEDGLTIERIDVNKGYCPENCCWIPYNEQAGNRRTSRIIEAWGESKTASEWARDSRCVVTQGTLLPRINKGMTPESAMTTPPREWQLRKINIVIPMSGLGQRFVDAGYTTIKPLLALNGSTMIENVIENVYIENCKFIFITQKEHCEKFNIEEILEKKCKILGCEYEIIKLEGQTKGAAETVLMAESIINNDKRTIIYNSDQLMIDFNCFNFINSIDTKIGTCGITVFKRINDPKWSYVEISSQGTIRNIVEKKAISEYATTGLYYYRYGRDCIKYIKEMVLNNDTVNSEFYLAPSINYAIKDKKRVLPYIIENMVPLGTPLDYEKYIGEKCQES